LGPRWNAWWLLRRTSDSGRASRIAVKTARPGRETCLQSRTVAARHLNDLTTLNSAVCARPEVCNCRFGADRRRHPFVPRYLQPTQQTEATTEVHMTMSRKTFVKAAAVGAAATTVLAHTAIGRDSALATRSIPSSGEQI